MDSITFRTNRSPRFFRVNSPNERKAYALWRYCYASVATSWYDRAQLGHKMIENQPISGTDMASSLRICDCLIQLAFARQSLVGVKCLHMCTLQIAVNTINEQRKASDMLLLNANLLRNVQHFSRKTTMSRVFGLASTLRCGCGCCFCCFRIQITCDRQNSRMTEKRARSSHANWLDSEDKLTNSNRRNN